MRDYSDDSTLVHGCRRRFDRCAGRADCRCGSTLGAQQGLQIFHVSST